MPTIQTEDFEDVDALLARLLPHQWGPSPRDWVFRGQRCACWKLLPSVGRADLRVEPGATPEIETEEGLRLAEWNLLRHFYRYSDAQGLTLPGDSVDLRDAVQSPRPPAAWLSEPWPPPPLRELTALAQHYGVPTRLLDWTRKPLVAAYFAIDGCDATECACPDAGDDGQVAIWALQRRAAARLRDEGLRFLTAPRGQIGNLHAQSGLFTVLSSTDGRSSLTPLEDLLISVLGPDSADPVAFRFRLPRAKAPDLLWALSANFVQGTTVYSGYEAAWKSIQERRIRRPPGR